jgi:hypothetical protein
VQRTENCMYWLELQVARSLCLAVHQDDDAWCWHERLSHANFGSLEKMDRLEMVRGLPPISHAEQFCDTCVLAKHHRGAPPKQSKYRASKARELVHGDLCGPVKPATPDGRCYFLLLVDDATRYMWVVLLAAKSVAAGAIKRVQAAAEKECGSKIRVMRTDNGGEFTAAEFAAYCANEGGHSTLLGTVHFAAERGGGAVKPDGDGDDAGAPEAVGGASGFLRGGRGCCSLPAEPIPDEESRRSHTL